MSPPPPERDSGIGSEACRSNAWSIISPRSMLPWALDVVTLGDSTLDIGRRNLPNTTVHHTSETDLPNNDETFSAAPCFLMLHHVPTADEQDSLFTETLRVLRPGGTFAGYDGLDTLGMRAAHRGDTFSPLEDSLPSPSNIGSAW